MNKVAKVDREVLYRKARDLLLMGLDRHEAVRQLEWEGFSRQRAKNAVAHARLRMNRPAAPTT